MEGLCIFYSAQSGITFLTSVRYVPFFKLNLFESVLFKLMHQSLIEVFSFDSSYRFESLLSEA